MNTQMIICMVIFAATLVSYMLNKIPMWLTAMISLAALYFTGCIDANGALAGFSNVNTLLMATMFVVAAGFRRTSVVDGLCNGIMKLTRGSFKTAYFGYILIAVLLANFIASPMIVYAIVSPLLAALCDKTGHSRSQYVFPVMVVCVACCGILPLATAIQGGRPVHGLPRDLRLRWYEHPPHRLYHRHLAGPHCRSSLGTVPWPEIHPEAADHSHRSSGREKVRQAGRKAQPVGR